MEEYLNFLRKKSVHCKFGRCNDGAMINQIICGIRVNNLRKRLLSVDDLNLDKAISLALQHESVERDSYLLANGLRIVSIVSP